MHKDTIIEAERWPQERQCLSCKRLKALVNFSPLKGKADQYRKICQECEQLQQYERHCRVTTHRDTWHWQQQERLEKRQNAWERSSLLRQIHEERHREQEDWYLQQPDRLCRTCHCMLPASAFRGNSSIDSFVLRVQCQTCHKAALEHRKVPCCLCHNKTARRDFLSQFKGYDLCGYGASISLCCKACESAFLELPAIRQCLCIRACCQRTFPTGQVIYAEVDPETQQIRYIGRTGKPRRRHAQHLNDKSPKESLWGSQRTAWYTRRNWMQALAEKKLTPSMRILQSLEITPLVLEWEQRFIWHGIQQGWNLLNWEMMDEELVSRVKTSHFDFFTITFEELVRQRLFLSHGLAAFLHEWCRKD